MEIKINDAGDVAKKRLYDYLDEKMKGEWDTAKWEFFNYLLEKSKEHQTDHSGFGSFDYQKDRDKARVICKQKNSECKKEEFRLLEKKTGRHL